MFLCSRERGGEGGWFVGDERLSPASVSRPESSTALRCGPHGKGTLDGVRETGLEEESSTLFHAVLHLAGSSPR